MSDEFEYHGLMLDFVHETFRHYRKFDQSINNLKDYFEHPEFRTEGAQKKIVGLQKICDAMRTDVAYLMLNAKISNEELDPLLKARSRNIYNVYRRARELFNTERKRKGIKYDDRGEAYGEVYLNSLFPIVPKIIYQNAIKYSLPRQEISTYYSEDAQKIEVRVENYGPVLEEDPKRVFEKGFRGSNASKDKSEGGGRGLYLAKILCEKNDVDIRAESDTRNFQVTDIPYGVFAITTTYYK
ncbi:sensor histidine kinase [Algimonas porphyrae]|uniref:sensor histidine kinase n=1 Tax=Algimonas porphyrae TaxID=1128113 RepID=UPI00352B4A22